MENLIKKASRIKLVVSVLLLAVLISCNDENTQESTPLAGKIGSADWSYKYAKANYNEIDENYDVELYGTQQTDSDPCSIFISGESHLLTQIPNAVGNYQIPSDTYVIFDQEGTNSGSFRATSGFMEVTAAAGGQIVAYMEATYDEDNTVSGTFSFSRCN